LLSDVTKPDRQATSDRARTVEFYAETKWCEACRRYVRFLMSIDHSYCIDCGGRVRLFSRADRARFGEAVQRHKWQAS
jgi:rRNA maturation endonuclease Nob1